MRFRRGGGMVARVGEKLLHIAPTHPAARRCGSLTLPHRRSAPPRKIQRSEATRTEKSFVTCKVEKDMIGQVNA
jgi:hypothetical protein